MNTTWSFLLLFLSTITGTETKSKEKECLKTYTCEYPEEKQLSTDVTIKRSTQNSVQDQYHHSNNENLKVTIKRGHEDSWEYRCKSVKGHHDTDVLKLVVEIDSCQVQFIHTAYIAAKTTISCDYKGNKYNHRDKFFCKQNGSVCEDILSLKSDGTFTLTETDSGFNMSISDVSSHHAGVYWCGVESYDRWDQAALRKIQLKVEVPPSPTSPVSSTQSTTVSAGSQVDLADSPLVIITVVVCVSVLLLLLLVLILILIYKRHFKNRRNAAQHIKEDYIYEEIQERPQKPDSGHAMNFPTNPSDSLYYSTVSFKNCSGEAGGEGLITRPCYSACEYSTVKDSQSPTNSTVNQPSSEDPLYSTVYKPQKQ